MNFTYQEMFPLALDNTQYKKLTGDFVSRETLGGKSVLVVESEGLTVLAREAMRDIAHLLRPGHLEQLRSILDDPEASENDRFVALELLKNANVAAGMVLPSCQDTGTAIVIGK
ncbi:MAG: fumarate hydratase, partial [Proteobacteria bacterium]|nr:fumarate hydratase [Pseudomonadota bacterium]